MALAYRSFHAIPLLTAKDGTPTNAVLGFVKGVRLLQERFQPTHQAVIFDGGLPAFRMERLPEYKAQRAPMPDDLFRQLPLLDEFLDAARLARVRLDGQEADDVIATLACEAERAGGSVVISTNDKDLFQLVSERVVIATPARDAPVMGPAEVAAKTGVPPARIPEWLALTGDSVDNIPGVPGVGPKTASRLLEQFPSIDALWAGIDTVSGDKLRESLRAAKSDVERNLALVTLDCAAAGVPALDDLRPAVPDFAALRAFFLRLDMPSLAPPVPVPTQMELL